MSQQQYVPQDGSYTHSTGSAETYQYKPAQARNSDMPKEEHPSTFEESLPPFSYPAQDRTARSVPDPAFTAHAHETNEQERRERRQRFSPDGDALENGYQPYQQQQRMRYQVPPWARPQQHAAHIIRRIVFVILIILLIKPILLLAGGILFTGLTMVGIVILIPLILLVALIITGLVFTILTVVLGRAVWRNGWRWHW